MYEIIEHYTLRELIDRINNEEKKIIWLNHIRSFQPGISSIYQAVVKGRQIEE